jgi:hypothetical protein
MTLEEQLLVGNSTIIWQAVADRIQRNPEEIEDLMELYFHEEYHRYNRATQAVGHLFPHCPDLIQPFSVRMAKFLQTHPPIANRRSIMRLFQWMDIDEEIEGILFDYAIMYLRSADDPAAVKAYAMVVARRICEKYPELTHEAIDPIEILIEENFSTGVVNRARKELKKLRLIVQKH